jgi:putative membrane protein
MTPDHPPRPHQEAVRDHLSNERTHLAWLRTALAIITFGIGLNRIGAYLNEVAASHGEVLPRMGTGRLGIGMVAAGMSLLVWGAVRYESVRRQIDRQDFRAARLAPWIVNGIILALSGVSLWLLLR